VSDIEQIVAWFDEQAAKEQRLLDTGSCNPSLTQERWLVYKASAMAVRDGLWKKPRQEKASIITSATITDVQINELHAIFPTVITTLLVEGALGQIQPHRNHARARIAELAQGLLCASCTPKYEVANHVMGHRFVGMGHGWQPCIYCGGSGLSELGQALRKDIP
jgi:hypothetical protein